MTPRKDCPAIHVDPMDLWIFLINSVRYSMGRRSTAPSMTCTALRQYAKHLIPQQRDQIRREIEQELSVEARHPGHLGDPCDVATWREMFEWLKENP